MIVSKPNFFLFTGGPGVGKTTLLEHLRARGERCVEETHRRVIRQQVAAGGSAVPWRDAQASCAAVSTAPGRSRGMPRSLAK